MNGPGLIFAIVAATGYVCAMSAVGRRLADRRDQSSVPLEEPTVYLQPAIAARSEKREKIAG